MRNGNKRDIENNNMSAFLKDDLDEILESTKNIWQELKGKHLFISGVTGFFGCWLLETIFHANKKLGCGIKITSISRDPEKFLKKYPHLALNENLSLFQADIKDFKIPEGPCDYIIHAATDANAAENRKNPLSMLDSIVLGTRNVLEMAKEKKVKKFLYVSSGSVYGIQPENLESISEDYKGAPDPLDIFSAYGEGKRVGELLSVLYGTNYDFEVKIVRCFAFVGPYMNFNGSFAVGNFIKDAVTKGVVEVKSPDTIRSYLYASDLMIAIFKILMSGKNNTAYNIGSSEKITMKRLADQILKLKSGAIQSNVTSENIANSGSVYLPDVSRISSEFGIEPKNDLVSSLRKTIAWYECFETKDSK